MKYSLVISRLLIVLLASIAISCNSEDEYGCAFGYFTLKGHILNENQEPIENLKIYITYPDDNDVELGEPTDKPYHHSTGTTNADGYFELNFSGSCNDNGTSELFKFGSFDPKGIYDDMDTIIGIKIVNGYRIRTIEFILKER